MYNLPRKIHLENRFDIRINDLLFRVLISEEPFDITDTFTFMPHNHSRYELQYVVDGRVYVHTDKIDYIAETSDVCITHPYEYHTYLKPADNRRSVVACLSFYLEENNNTDKGKAAFWEFKEMLDNAYTFRDDSGTIGLFFDRIKTEFSKKQPGHLISIQALLTALLVCLVQNLSSQQSSNMTPISAPRIMERELIIEDYFMHNHMLDLSIEELAERLHLCTRRVSQLIQQLYGCSFSQKLCTTRIEVAKLRLLYSNDSIQEIGALCGFNSPNYFFTTFRKFTGMSPREYRLSAKVPFPEEVKYNW